MPHVSNLDTNAARVDPHPYRQLEALSSLLQQSESRQQRAAAELHDNAVQMLAATLVLLDTAERKAVASGLAGGEIAAARNATAQVMDRLLRVTFDLCPQLVHALGLRDGLCGVAERAGAQAGWQVRVGGDGRRLAPEAEALAFGAGCEAIENARRHAAARTLDIDVAVHRGWLTLTVADDGVGFALDRRCCGAAQGTPSGLELTAQRLHNAGGRLVVDSAPGLGTRVAVWLPV